MILWLRIASITMLLGVAAGAFGAHGLKNILSDPMKAVYETAVRYQLVHGLALFVVAWLSTQTAAKNVPLAGWLFTVGIFLFSGSLYALSLTNIRILGAITPLGGVCFLVGWGSLLLLRLR